MPKRSSKSSTRRHSATPTKSRKTTRKVARKAAPITFMGGGKAGKHVYYFGGTRTEGNAGMKPLLGGKGANLADMTSIGLPVPPGFTITTETCAAYYKNGQRLPTGLMNEVHKNTAVLEKELGKKFGSNDNPLLVSVRSGAARSTPCSTARRSRSAPSSA